MFCATDLRSSVLVAAALVLTGANLSAQSLGRDRAANPVNSATQGQSTQVHLHWGARPGVSRYRLQLAGDLDFNDIVFDRVVAGTEYSISDLTAGRYFWRVAALTAQPLQFSSAGVVDVKPEGQAETSNVRQADNSRATASPNVNRLASGDGWRALIGDVSSPVAAHLRSASALDLVTVNSAGVVYALAAESGIVLWTARPRTQIAPQSGVSPIVPLLVRSRTGQDNVIVLAGNVAFAFDPTGRELWRVPLPAPVSSGAVLGSELFILDNSLRKLFLVDGGTGKMLTQTELPSRAFGAPVAFDRAGQRAILLAFENGRVEVRDANGKTIRSGDAGSPATTRPLFVSGARGGLVLLGTRGGLTAFDGEDLRALGRVALKDDAPRGTLAAADLNGDGAAEVIMVTEHGRVVAVNAVDGKILWESTSTTDAQNLAFADVNGDHVLDVVVAGGQTFAMALSGRDGSVVWKDDEGPALVANHAASFLPRSVIAAPHGSGLLLIASDPSRIGLRAIGFSNGTAGPPAR